MKLATWNVQNNAAEKKNRHFSERNYQNKNHDIGISRRRWRGNGDFRKDGFYVALSGNDDHIGGVGIVVEPSLASPVESICAESDRVIVTRVKSLYQSICIFHCIEPTCDKDEAAAHRLSSDIEKALKKAKHNESVFVMRDFNANVGNLPEKLVVGPLGLGTRNDKRDKIVE